MTPRVGVLATANERTNQFWSSAFDANGVLVTERAWQLWEAIIAAHVSDHYGQGRCIAIIDGRFDLSFIPADRIHPASRVSNETPVVTGNPHGTLVALLALTAAPMAQVLLFDAMANDVQTREDLVANGINLAVENRADIINLSMEFPTECRLRDLSDFDAALGGNLDPEPEVFLSQVDQWITRAEPYTGPRCPSECEVCDALSSVPDTTLVVAAAGNLVQAACPACFRAVVGVGFHSTVQTIVGDSTVRRRVPSATEGNAPNRLLYEVTVEEPPGFIGTSYASPMLSGLAALLENPADVGRIAQLSLAVAPLAAQVRVFLEAEPSSIPERAGRTLLGGLTRMMDAIPESHRHWEIGKMQPCPLCSTVLAEWYNALAAVAGRLAIPQALSVAVYAAAVSPVSAAAAGNLGNVWLRRALEDTGGPECRGSLNAAKQSYTSASLLAESPEVEAYFFQRRETVEKLLDQCH